MSAPQVAAPAVVRASVLKHSLRVDELEPALGAEITNINVADAVQDPDLAAEIGRLWRKYKVIFFRDQSISNADHQSFAQLFGELEPHPIFKGLPDAQFLLEISNHDGSGKPKVNNAYENGWHADLTYTLTPPAGSLLRMIEGPAVGGDTMWANMALIYEKLPQEVKDLIDGLYAKHSIEQTFFSVLPTETRLAMAQNYPQVEHPVVVVHPVTKEKVLYVGAFMTTHFSNYYSPQRVPYGGELSRATDLMRYLVSQTSHPEFQVRFRWRPNSIAMWDNMLTQHYAVHDYTALRRMVRATLKGSRPSK